MRKRRYLLAASVGVIGALLVSGTASADADFNYTATISPKGQSAKKFRAAAMTSSLDASYTGEFAQTTPGTGVVQFSNDIKFTPGKLAQCDLSTISTVPDSTAMALCGKSKIGEGNVVVNGVAVTGKVTLYNAVPSGGSPTIGFHTDLFSPSGAYVSSTTGVGVLNTETNVLTTSTPPTGTTLAHVDVTIDKVKTSGKKDKKTNGKKGKKTYYVMARCKKKQWVNTATEVFADGSTRSSTSVQKCKAKK